jgi:hypothetical protein
LVSIADEKFDRRVPVGKLNSGALGKGNDLIESKSIEIPLEALYLDTNCEFLFERLRRALVFIIVSCMPICVRLSLQ